jgi:hypothetical protein
MSAPQDTPAEFGVERQTFDKTCPDIRQSRILQPPDIKKTPIYRLLRPAEKDISCRLHYALPDHHALPLVDVIGRPRERGEHRFLRLRDLQ